MTQAQYDAAQSRIGELYGKLSHTPEESAEYFRLKREVTAAANKQGMVDGKLGVSAPTMTADFAKNMNRLAEHRQAEFERNHALVDWTRMTEADLRAILAKPEEYASGFLSHVRAELARHCEFELAQRAENAAEVTTAPTTEQPTIIYFLQTCVRGPWENMTPFPTIEEAGAHYHKLMEKAHRHGKYRVVRYEQTAVILGND